MKRRCEFVFLPGFDGVAELRRPFMDALGRDRVVPVTYPNAVLGSLDGYVEFARKHAVGECVLIAESFSGLVAARWAGQDPRVRAVALCGCFAGNPVGWITSMGAAAPSIVRLGARFMAPSRRLSPDSLGYRWSDGLSTALRAMDPAVIRERLRLIAREHLVEDLQNLRVPVALVQFERDLVIHPRERARLERACPSAAVIRIDGPHFAIETMPVECANAIATHFGTVF